MGSTWVLSAPDGPHVGAMNHAIKERWCEPDIVAHNISITSQGGASSSDLFLKGFKFWTKETRNGLIHPDMFYVVSQFSWYWCWFGFVLCILNRFIVFIVFYFLASDQFAEDASEYATGQRSSTNSIRRRPSTNYTYMYILNKRFRLWFRFSILHYLHEFSQKKKLLF